MKNFLLYFILEFKIIVILILIIIHIYLVLEILDIKMN